MILGPWSSESCTGFGLAVGVTNPGVTRFAAVVMGVVTVRWVDILLGGVEAGPIAMVRLAPGILVTAVADSNAEALTGWSSES
jgi:hypothetical protein